MIVKYLSVSQVLLLHEQLIGRFGGSLGLRDRALLESAVFRCQQSFEGKDLYPNLISKAAALMESLCMNHPFVDGNKRISFLATIVFLDINGLKTEFDVDKAEIFMLKVASGENRFNEILNFLEESCT